VRQLHRGLQEGQLLADQPDLDEPYDALLEALGRLGATTAIPVVEPFLQHPLARVRYSAHRAMYQLTNHPIYGDHLIEALQAQQLQLRRAALADLGAIGYLPAADAIAATLAENSLKLIALKGLLEKQIDLCELHTISPESIHVMNLMDQLL
jgi:phycocyanobilin lyase alpha subunit